MLERRLHGESRTFHYHYMNGFLESPKSTCQILKKIKTSSLQKQ